ncbi:prolyl oligopeptidase family serine peptidase [Robbsia andropogonis]|uniref:prolyl oligopeptidase family serine peptidase n=1 Tax=Robbsia andropogonis TaxID=28092 RepID=UPI0012FB1485|nr:prolyl oligopeptidase family serine peptidase [Robbsia andropogonis]MCP1119088.1 prolyl oligopeptidase family serine peptidase [Robbsia andropogonis]MCP1129061.1 prolyl oligopeptidase family serine peptidase [Robbsia andropogonis]
MAVVLLGGCASQVTHYGLNDHFSASEVLSGATTTREACSLKPDTVWVDGADFAECIKYYPSSDFVAGKTHRAIVAMEGDWISGRAVGPRYAKRTPRDLYDEAEREQAHDHMAWVLLGRPGTDGSSGDQKRRRQRYETAVINAAIDKLKQRYEIREFGLIGQSGGGGLVGALIAERNDVLCAVPTSGVLSVKARAELKGQSVDATGTSFGNVWDPIDHVNAIHPMPGFRLFAVSSISDSNVPFSTQTAFVEAVKDKGIEAYQIAINGTGAEHHQTMMTGMRVVQACMDGLPSAFITKTFTGLTDNARQANALSEIVNQAARAGTPTGAP